MPPFSVGIPRVQCLRSFSDTLRLNPPAIHLSVSLCAGVVKGKRITPAVHHGYFSVNSFSRFSDIYFSICCVCGLRIYDTKSAMTHVCSEECQTFHLLPLCSSPYHFSPPLQLLVRVNQRQLPPHKKMLYCSSQWRKDKHHDWS